MTWATFRVSRSGTHHVDEHGSPVYAERFDSVLAFHDPGLAPVRCHGQAWHIHSDGSAAYTRRFAGSFGYYEGLAAVIGPDGWHHIRVDGSDAYARRFTWCGNFQQMRCAVRDHDGRYHHIAPTGVAAYPQVWHYAGDYRDGVAVVQASDGRSTHIGLDGSRIHDVWFLDLDVFHKGFARAQDTDGWMHVDMQGRPAYTRRFQSVEPFYNGQARVERFDGALEVIDEGGKTLVVLRPARRSEFACLSSDMVGFWKTQALAAAVELGVIEALPATESELADRCGLPDDGSRRILRALGELSIVSRKDELWILTPRGEMLRADHPLTLADAAVEYADRFSSMWRRLPSALRRDGGWSAPDVFDAVALDDTRCVGHHRMLRSYARHDYAEVASALDLQGDERLVDAGGGLGVLAQLIVEAYPGVQVTILERPEVVAMASTPMPSMRWQCANLFEPWNMRADAALLSRVLHDWDDDKAIQILSSARSALPLGGRVYIIEMLIPEGSVAGGLCDLHLLMATGGRERSAAHFEKLLSLSGFELEAVRRLPALPSIIVGVAS